MWPAQVVRGMGLAALSLGVVGLAGCSPAQQPAARAAIQQFQTALQHQDVATACALLSDRTRHVLESVSTQPCARALPALRLSTGSVTSLEVWGRNAQARLDSDTVFAAQVDQGWRVTAVGCTPVPDQPYDCTLEG